MARRLAREAGFRGAMFPWQSGSDGREETQLMHLNPRSGRWLADHSRLQRHVNLAICVNVWNYHQATGSRPFLEGRGAELLFEIARFFESLATYSAAEDRFEIRRVMGPDEYHDAYPGAEHPGIDNNAYTNVLVAWLMDTCRTVLARMDADARAELVERLGLDADEEARWEHMSRRMKVCFHRADGGEVISQFQGYGELKALDWDAYRERYGNIQRMDRILEAEGDSANGYQVSKQADVLMLFYLFSPERLAALLGRLGYAFGPADWQRNVDYYLARTSHGSTLSYVVHSWVMAKAHPEEAWRLFTKALSADIGDIQGGTTAEGIHLGAMAGTVDLVQRCFTGMEVFDDALHFAPVLTERLTRLRLRVRYRGHWIGVEVRPGELSLHAHAGWPQPVRLYVCGEAVTLAPDERRSFSIPAAAGGAQGESRGARR
jgi:trehalose/maltose hydrolase-like predicted phosphorylase